METKVCPACKNDVGVAEINCSICEFPFEGTEKEKSIHIGRFIGKKGVIIDAEDHLIKSRNLLFLAAGFYALGTFINLSFLLKYPVALIINIAVISILVMCGILIKRAPLFFLIFPLALLFSIYLSNYLNDPSSIYNGILFKIIILGSLIYSIYLYLASKKFKKKYKI